MQNLHSHHPPYHHHNFRQTRHLYQGHPAKIYNGVHLSRDHPFRMYDKIRDSQLIQTKKQEIQQRIVKDKRRSLRYFNHFYMTHRFQLLCHQKDTKQKKISTCIISAHSQIHILHILFLEEFKKLLTSHH